MRREDTLIGAQSVSRTAMMGVWVRGEGQGRTGQGAGAVIN